MDAEQLSQGVQPDALSTALLPVLLHEVANVTQTLTGLNAILAMEGGSQLFAERAHDLARSGHTASDLGWALAVLGTAGGSNLLLARREPRGLSILFSLLHKACRREELTLSEPTTDLPLLAPACLDGWQLPWALASLVLGSARDGGGDWQLSASHGHWVFSWGTGTACGASAEAIVRQLPGALFVANSEGPLQLRLPGEWLAPTK